MNSENKEINFDFKEAGKEKAAKVQNKLAEKDFQHCFEQFKIRRMFYRYRGGVYVESNSN